MNGATSAKGPSFYVIRHKQRPDLYLNTQGAWGPFLAAAIYGERALAPDDGELIKIVFGDLEPGSFTYSKVRL